MLLALVATGALAAGRDEVRPAFLARERVPALTERLGASPVCPMELGAAWLWCLRLREPAGGEVIERWLLPSDLSALGVSEAELVAGVRERVLAQFTTLVVQRPMIGMPASYALAADADGWSAGLAVVPDRLALRCGEGPLRLAFPNVGVALAWTGRSQELDLVMAVGVHEMTLAQRKPLTDLIVTWDGERWVDFARAAPTAQ